MIGEAELGVGEEAVGAVFGAGRRAAIEEALEMGAQVFDGAAVEGGQFIDQRGGGRLGRCCHPRGLWHGFVAFSSRARSEAACALPCC